MVDQAVAGHILAILDLCIVSEEAQDGYLCIDSQCCNDNAQVVDP